MNSGPIAVLVQYRALPERSPTAPEELTHLVSIVVDKEPECLGIRLYQDPKDDTRFLLHERGKDHAYYLGPHGETPRLQASIQRVREFLVGPPQITLWKLRYEAQQGSEADGGAA